MDVRVGLWRKLSAEELMLLNCGVGEDSWESHGLQGNPISPFWRRSVLGVHWKNWCWSWNSNTFATSCKELTYLKRPQCWERLKAGGEGDDRGWDGWMASLTQWTWVSVNSGSWWWTGRPGVLQSMGLQRVRHDWATELNWTDGVRKCSDFILLHVAVQFSQHHLLKKLSSPHCIFLPPLSKIRYPEVHGFISGLSILFHWSIFLFLCQYHTVSMTEAL